MPCGQFAIWGASGLPALQNCFAFLHPCACSVNVSDSQTGLCCEDHRWPRLISSELYWASGKCLAARWVSHRKYIFIEEKFRVMHNDVKESEHLFKTLKSTDVFLNIFNLHFLNVFFEHWNEWSTTWVLNGLKLKSKEMSYTWKEDMQSNIYS